MMNETTRTNPTRALDISFSAYANKRKTEAGKHLIGGVPDYTYGADYEMMRKINAIPGAYKLLKAIASSYVPAAKEKYNLTCMKVGPTQRPDIYEMTKDCADRLKIGVPEIYIQGKVGELNAFTIASEDSAPLIILYSALVERLTPGELKSVIGHECGHIHNNHGIYKTVINVVFDSIVLSGIPNIPAIALLLDKAMRPLQWALNAWSRASEVTADRAGLICTDDFNDAINSEAKLLYGATFNNESFNIDAIIKQYDRIRSTPARMLELDYNHPASARRIMAVMEFMNSEVLYGWRPEKMKAGETLISKQELDMRCEKIISVTKSERRKV